MELHSRPGACAQALMGCISLALSATILHFSKDPVYLAVTMGWSLAGAGQFATVAPGWAIAMGGAGLSLILFPMRRARLLVLIASVFVATSAGGGLAPAPGTGSRVILSHTDVPGVPTYYTRPPYLLKSGKDFERGVNTLLGMGGQAISEMLGAEARRTADNTVKDLRAAPVLKAFERKIATTFDNRPMSKADLERTKQPLTQGDMRPSSPFVAR